MKVEELMCKNVKACSPDDSLASAAKLMWDNDCGCTPVVDAGGHCIGMITDRDICMATYLNSKAPQELRVQGTMSRTVLACRPEEKVADAEALMRRAQVRRVPVNDGSGRLVGILSLNNIALEAEREKRTSQRDVTHDEVGATLSAVCQPRASTAAARPS